MTRITLSQKLRAAGFTVSGCDDHLRVSLGARTIDLWPATAQWRERGVGKPRLGIRTLIRELNGKPRSKRCSTTAGTVRT